MQSERPRRAPGLCRGSVRARRRTPPTDLNGVRGIAHVENAEVIAVRGDVGNDTHVRPVALFEDPHVVNTEGLEVGSVEEVVDVVSGAQSHGCRRVGHVVEDHTAVTASRAGFIGVDQQVASEPLRIDGVHLDVVRSGQRRRREVADEAWVLRIRHVDDLDARFRTEAGGAAAERTDVGVVAVRPDIGVGAIRERQATDLGHVAVLAGSRSAGAGRRSCESHI